MVNTQIHTHTHTVMSNKESSDSHFLKSRGQRAAKDHCNIVAGRPRVCTCESDTQSCIHIILFLIMKCLQMIISNVLFTYDTDMTAMMIERY